MTTYFNGASSAIVVGDLGKKKSIKEMRFWAESIQDNIGRIPLFFVGTKKNMKTTKNMDKLAELANKYNTKFYVFSRSQEEGWKPILKSIAKHLAKIHCRLLAKDYGVMKFN